MSKLLAELLEGRIGYYSNPAGKGSVFWFTSKVKKVQPVKALDTLQEEIARPMLQTSTSPSDELRIIAADKRVLIADDNLINQKVMVIVLTKLGFHNIDLAIDGREAVTMSTKDSPPYHVILMDIRMPLLDGVGATKEIRRAGVDTPIIAMTDTAMKEHVESYMAAGMNDYVMTRTTFVKTLVKVLLQWLKTTPTRTD